MTENAEPVRVAIAGLGRSGWNIHAKNLRGMSDRYVVAAVTDPDATRRQEAAAELGAKACATHEELVASDAEVVVVASPSRFHADHAVAALEAGKHVVCEKPFALSVADADRMIDAAQRAERFITPFQNRRYEAHFRKVREIVASGVLGNIFLIRLAVHGFSRRWDWQTLREHGGGQLANWGPHLLDHAVQFLGSGELDLWVDMRNGLASGDAEDHVKLVLRAEDGPTIDVEITSCCAFPQDRWQVMGTSGGLTGSQDALRWRWVDWSEHPERPVDTAPSADRTYNGEKLNWQEASWTSPEGGRSGVRAFYNDLYETLRRGRPLAITPQSARRYLEIVDRCRDRYAPQPPAYRTSLPATAKAEA